MKKRSLRIYAPELGVRCGGPGGAPHNGHLQTGRHLYEGDSDTVLLVVSLALIVAGLGVQIKFLRCPRLRRVPLFPVEVDRILPPLRHKSGLGRNRIKQSAR